MYFVWNPVDFVCIIPEEAGEGRKGDRTIKKHRNDGSSKEDTQAKHYRFEHKALVPVRDKWIALHTDVRAHREARSCTLHL